MDVLNTFAMQITNIALAWDIENFLKGARKSGEKWGGLLIGLIGVIMIIVAVYQIAKGLMTHGKGQTNWAVAILLLIIGGAFAVGGYALVFKIAEGGRKTIEDLGDSGNTIIPMLSAYFH